MASNTNACFIAGACLSGCVVLLTLCGPLTPFESEAGSAPWFESEVTYKTKRFVNIFDPVDNCQTTQTVVTAQWSMYGFDYVSHTSCMRPTLKLRETNDVTKSYDYTALCDLAGNSGAESLCGKKNVVIAFFWLAVVFAIMTCALAVAGSFSKFAVMPAAFAVLMSVIGFSVGASMHEDLEEHLKSTYSGATYRSVTYEVQNQAGFALAAASMVLTMLVIVLVIGGLLRSRRDSEHLPAVLAVPVESEDVEVAVEAVEEPPTLLNSPSRRESKDEDDAVAHVKEEHEQEQALAEVKEMPAEIDVDLISVEVADPPSPVDEAVEAAIAALKRDDDSMDASHWRLAQLASMEAEQDAALEAGRTAKGCGVEESNVHIPEIVMESGEAEKTVVCGSCLM